VQPETALVATADVEMREAGENRYCRARNLYAMHGRAPSSVIESCAQVQYLYSEFQVMAYMPIVLLRNFKRRP